MIGFGSSVVAPGFPLGGAPLAPPAFVFYTGTFINLSQHPPSTLIISSNSINSNPDFSQVKLPIWLYFFSDSTSAS